MIKAVQKTQKRQKRHAKIRKTIIGTSDKPRLNIYRSNKSFYAQIIDDSKGTTIVSAHTKELKVSNNNIETCSKLGELLGKKASKAGIKELKFDRGGYLYHGKVKSFADSVRAAGIKF